ncbi:hypothetical protein SUGI_0497440 [Cryptomeria japonica]|uniref:uncharacterized protein LOC131062470 n=1 Tax=Cryptomeria japonica TaxID=3369 RepID=UPI002408C5B0|nr:uncharacterized protein LOC131062470 [Cryptomeria japonica]XP_059077425.1 uncharacterized protein LOC131062470 [Cryptomeria japonica]GLJ25950.1 hypothetical protein SUGI_0497440 [Cryptomeria japonica]
MHLTIWKSVALCTALLFNKGKKKGRSQGGTSNKPASLKEKQEMKLRQALEEASEDGFLSKSQALLADDEEEVAAVTPGTKSGILHSRTLVRLKAQRDFLTATAQAAERFFDSEESILGLDEAYAKFKKMYPKFDSTEEVDEIRSDEYGHLEETLKVCLDYCGFGLFSYLQQFQHWEGSSFGLSAISANLSSHALNGLPEEGTAELDIRNRIMDYLSIPQSEYSMVFTVSRGSAFNLLAEAYPFHQNRRLLTMYDYESESINWMAQTAREKGAKVHSAWFKWPTLRLCSSELRKQLQHKKRRKKDSALGLFVFPVQSRVTGAKYSYQWMSLAQQNRWHVLLDAGALGPKDMDSLGLSLFRPDFIITSFYKVFGSDPTGFGCLFIKNSVLGCLQNKGNTGTGMVRIIPVSPQYLSDSGERHDGTVREIDGTKEIGEEDDGYGSEFPIGPHLPAFSGAFSSAQVRDVFESEMEYENNSDRDGASTICEEIDNLSVDEIMKSPIFSEEENEDLMCIDLGESPGGLNTSKNFRKSPPSNLGLRQLHNGFSQRTKHKKSSTETISKSSTEGYGNGPIYDEEKKSLGVNNEIVSFDAAVSSVSQDITQTKLVSDAQTSCLKGNTEPLQDDIKKSTPKKSRELDTRESVYNGQGKSQADREPSKPNGNSFSHGSSQGDNLLSKDEMGISRRVDSQRFPKQTRITFNLDGEGSVSAGYKIDDNRDKGGSHTSGQGMGIAGEVVQSVSSEISSCDKDDKHFMERPIHAKQNIVNATTSLANGPREPGKVCFSVGSKQNPAENGCTTKESCIRRETEGAFRLLGRREEEKFSSCRFPGLEEDRFSSSRRMPYSLEEHGDYFEQSGEESEATFYQEDGILPAAEEDDEDQWNRREPQIFCRHLDHVDALGLNKTTLRLRYLINWLVTSLLQFRHPSPDGGIPLVHIYGPKIRYDRGAAVAFNLYDHSGTLVNPELVQKLAEADRISLGLGFLSHLRLMDNYAELQEALDANNTSFCKPMANGRYEGKNVTIRVEVVTASLGFLTNFEDVYRLWAFVAKFLNANFAKGDGSQSASHSEHKQ